MSSALARSPFAPWAGIAFGALGWGLHQQVLGDILYWSCRGVTPVVDIIFTVLTTLLILGGGWWSWLARQAEGAVSEEQSARKFLAEISLAAAALFLLATFAQTLAGFIIPECHR